MNFLFVDACSSSSFYWAAFNHKCIVSRTGYYHPEKTSNLSFQENIAGIFLGLPRNIFIAKEIEFPPLSLENIKEALRYKIPKLFYFINDPFFVFFPLKQDYSKIIVLVCEQKIIKKIIYDIEDIFQAKVVSVFFSALSISSFFKLSKKKFILILKKADYKEIVIFNNKLQNYFIDNNNYKLYLNYPDYEQVIYSWNETTDDNFILNSQFLKYLLKNFKNKQNHDDLLFNILPERIKFLKKNKSYHKIGIYLFIISCIILILSPLAKIILQVNRLKEYINKVTPEVNQLKSITIDTNKKKEDIQKLIGYFQIRKLDILSLVAKNLPKKTNIEYVSINQNWIKLKGYAPRAPDVLSSLNKVKILNNVRFTASILKRKQLNKIVESFSIEAQIVKK